MDFPAIYCRHRFFFFFNDTATTEIYTLSLHDALPISAAPPGRRPRHSRPPPRSARRRSEEHTSELQSRQYLVCRLLLEKKNTHTNRPPQQALQRAEPHQQPRKTPT